MNSNIAIMLITLWFHLPPNLPSTFSTLAAQPPQVISTLNSYIWNRNTTWHIIIPEGLKFYCYTLRNTYGHFKQTEMNVTQFVVTFLSKLLIGNWKLSRFKTLHCSTALLLCCSTFGQLRSCKLSWSGFFNSIWFRLGAKIIDMPPAIVQSC